MSSPCQFDEDCPGSLVCFTNITWYDESALNAPNNCLCSTWYGHSGVGCLEANTPTANWWVATGVIHIVICLVLLVLAVLNTTRMYRLSRRCFMNATSTASFQLIFAFMFIAVQQSLWIYETLNPQTVSVVTDPGTDKIGETHIAREIIFIFGICGVVLSALTVAIVWVEVSERAKKMSKVGTVSPIKNTKKVIYVFEAFVALGMIICSAVRLPYYATLIGMTAAVACVVLYSVGYFKLRRQLSEISSANVNAPSGSSDYKKLLREITVTASVVVVFATMVIILCIVIVALSLGNWKDSSTPFAIPAISISWQLVVSGLLGMAGSILVGLYQAIRRQTQSEKASSSAHDGDGSFKSPRMKASPSDLGSSFNSMNPKESQIAQTSEKTIAAYHEDE